MNGCSLEHGLGAEAGAHDVADGLGRRDVLLLDLLALVTLRVLAQHHDGAGSSRAAEHDWVAFGNSKILGTQKSK